MPLRHRIIANPETVQDLELAAEHRYWEGVELLLAGHQHAGAYLLGYSAEMWLKHACFMFDGARPHDLIGRRLPPMRVWGRTHLPSIECENYHSLWFWAHTLRERRRLHGRPLSLALDARLMQAARRLFGIWIVDMRYHPRGCTPREAQSVYDDVTWLRDQRLRLGS